MFCTQCGTQIDQGKNFCKNCGARVGGSAPSAPNAQAVGDVGTGTAQAGIAARGAETTSRRAQPASTALSSANAGNNKLIIAAAAVGFIVLAGAGIYFGTDLLKPSVNEPPRTVAEPMAKTNEAEPLPNFEETKEASPAGDAGTAADSSQTLEPLPGAVEPPKPIENKAPAKADVAPPFKSQFQRAGQEPSPAVRGSRPAAPVSPARGAASGVYETLRATTVYEDPSASSRILASIPAGTRVNVVNSHGEWLEVHSKRGNPPGFIRRGDASFVESSN